MKDKQEQEEKVIPKKPSRGFKSHLEARYLGHCRWRLIAPLVYVTSEGETITAPVGFITDGKSIPRLAQSIVGAPWAGKSGKSAGIHDLLCYTQQFPRAKTDRIFLECMEDEKETKLRRRIFYRFVRMFGWIPWNKRREEILDQR